MNIDAQTKTKLHDMGAGALADAIDAQDETTCTGMTFAERLQAAVDEAHSQFVTSKVANLTKRARLRYPEADVRRLEHVEERKLSRTAIAELATCGFAERCDNLVLQGYSGTGKTYLSCALAKEACRRRMRSFYARVPDVEELRRAQVLASILFSPFPPMYLRRSRHRSFADPANADAPLPASPAPPSRRRRRATRPSGGTTARLSL